MPRYDENFNENSSQYKILAQINKKSIVLEFGCASGYMSKYMNQKLGCKVYGIELCAEALSKAYDFLEKGICTDIDEMKWREELAGIKFDVITFADVLEHLKNPENVLINAAELLNDDGKILISVPNIAHADIILKLMENRFDYTETGLLDNTHIHFWGIKNLRDLCEKCGLFLAVLDGTICRFQESEQKTELLAEKNVVEMLIKKPYAMVYQFVFSAYKKNYAIKNGIKKEFPIDRISEKIAEDIAGRRFISLSSKIYFDCGGLSEESAIRVPIISGEIKTSRIAVPPKCTMIRFDPIENNCCIVGGLVIGSSSGILTVQYENSERITNGNYYFSTPDPQFYIPILAGTVWIEINCNIVVLESIFAQKAVWDMCNEISELKTENEQEIQKHNSDFAQLHEESQKQLAEKDSVILNLQEEHRKQLEEKNSVILNLQEENRKQIAEKDSVISDLKEKSRRQNAENDNVKAELSTYREHYHAAISQREQLKAELSAWQDSYNAISQSHFWRLTASARKMCNGIKKILKSNRVTYLFCKGLISLKREGVKATWRKIKMKYFSCYRLQEIVKDTSLSEQERRQQEETVFPKDIKFSILVPLYNTPINFLEEMIVSVIAQTYGNWELCLADGSDKEHGNVEKAVKKIKANDKRIKYQKLEKNLGISDNTNICIEMATGDYIALFDHDDLLHPAALFEVMKAICERNADFVYTDENTFSQNVQDSYCPHFKPDFSPDTLRSYNYICHLSVFKKSLLDKIGGGFRREFDGSQDYDMILRLTEKAHHIVHIPKILYFWRAHINSVAQDVEAKPYAITAAKKALAEHLKRVELEGEVIDSSLISTYKINYKIKGQPLISIIIPSKDHLDDLDKCLRSIKEKSTYKNYEIIIVENNSIESSTFDYYKKIERRNIRVVYWKDEFNYSKINNFGVKHSKGDYILLLNNDIEIITENWLEEMLMFAQRRDVGAVGAMLYYPDETIQHAGVILGIGGVAGHSHKHFPRKSYGYASRLTIAQNLSCVTAACLLTKRAVWDEIGGLNDAYQIAFNDVDLCMRIRRAGYLIVWTPYAEAYHYESKSRGYEDTPEKQKRFSGEVLRFMDEWKSELEAGDPYYNPNLSLVREDFSLR